MKTRTLSNWSLGLLLASLPLASGCSQGSAQTAPENDAVTQTQTTIAPDTNAPIDVATAPEDQKPAVVISDQKTLPPSINPSGPTESVIRMAQAGVDESVMLAFVSNSISTFNLTSDDIIYLRDIGVPDSVVMGMIQRDQTLKEMNNEQAAAAAASAAQTQTETNYEQPTATQADGTAYVSAPPQNINYNYFYDSLSPYGSWVDVDGYGWCWQPTVAVINVGWQPYCNNGRWIYTSCGWYWYSNYSWGWAPFHYGRWFRSPRWGWCWRPGQTWGPAWVSWRYSNNYCGWAPLPPAAHYTVGVGYTYNNVAVSASFGFGLNASCYTFVPVNRFCDDHPYHYRVPHNQAGVVYQQTTVNNVVLQRNHTVFNRGIEPTMITAVTRTPIHPVQIQNVSSPASQSRRTDWLEPGGRRLAVYHPPLHQRTPEANHGFSQTHMLGGQQNERHSDNRVGGQAWQPAGPNHVTPTTVNNSHYNQQPTLGNAPVRSTPPTTSRGSIVMPNSGYHAQPSPRSAVQSTPPTMNQAPARSPAPAIHMQGPRGNNQPAQSATPPASSRNIIMRGSGNHYQPVPGNSVQSAPPTMNQAPARSQSPAIHPQTPTFNQQPVQRITPPQGAVSRPAWNQPRAFNSAPAMRTRTYTPPVTATAPQGNHSYHAPVQNNPVVRQQAPAFSPRGRSEMSVPHNSPAPHFSAPRMNSAPTFHAPQSHAMPAQNMSPRAEQNFQSHSWNGGGNGRGHR